MFCATICKHKTKIAMQSEKLFFSDENAFETMSKKNTLRETVPAFFSCLFYTSDKNKDWYKLYRDKVGAIEKNPTATKGCVNVFFGKDAVDEMMYFALSHPDDYDMCANTNSSCDKRTDSLLLWRMSQIQSYCSLESCDEETYNLSSEDVLSVFDDEMIARLNKTGYVWDILIFDELGFMTDKQISPKASCYVDTSGEYKHCKIFLFANKSAKDDLIKCLQFDTLWHEMAHTFEMIAQIKDENFTVEQLLKECGVGPIPKPENLPEYAWHERLIYIAGATFEQFIPTTLKLRKAFNMEFKKVSLDKVKDFTNRLLEACAEE